MREKIKKIVIDIFFDIFVAITTYLFIYIRLVNNYNFDNNNAGGIAYIVVIAILGNNILREINKKCQYV